MTAIGSRQDSPILVRPHPAKMGHYQIVFVTVVSARQDNLGAWSAPSSRNSRTEITSLPRDRRTFGSGQPVLHRSGRCSRRNPKRTLVMIGKRFSRHQRSTPDANKGCFRSPKAFQHSGDRSRKGVGCDRWFDLTLLIEKPSNLAIGRGPRWRPREFKSSATG